MSHITLKGCWCDVIVLNVHAPTEDKTHDMRDSFYEELECIIDQFPMDHMKIRKEYLEDMSVNSRIILKWTLNRMGGRGLDSSGSGQGQLVGFCEHGNEPSGSIKCWECLD
jgi:hypothetical protein